MGREIKFRGIYPHSGKWVFGSFVNSFPDTPRIVSEGFSTPIKIETLGQFTGLKDKNGVEIYEGDIVRFKRGQQQSDESFQCSVPVQFRSGSFFCGADPLSDWTHRDNIATRRLWVSYGSHGQGDIYYKDFDIEVIGNIHETPELLSN